METFLKFIDWVKDSPAVMALLILIAVDVTSGVMVACVKRTLNSTTSFIGITRKVFMLMLLGAGSALQPFANGLPLSQLMAMYYLVTEAISISENAAALGVPLPKVWTDMLEKLRQDEQKRTEQSRPPDKAP